MGEPIVITKRDLKALDKFRKLGLINEVSWRDYCLKKEYRKRIKQNRGKRKYIIRAEMVQEYNEKNRGNGQYLTEENLYAIVFRKKD